jgi:hypothetical protein
VQPTHITGNLSLLKNKINATKCPSVIIANSSKVPIEQIRITKLFSNNVSDVCEQNNQRTQL